MDRQNKLPIEMSERENAILNDQWRDDQCDRCNRVGHERFLVVHLYSDMEPWEEFGRAHRCKTPEECGLCEGINYSVGTVVADG